MNSAEVLCAVAGAIPSVTGLQSVGDVTEYYFDGRAFFVSCGDAVIRITHEGEGVIRVRLAPDGAFGRDHSWAVILQEDDAAEFRLEEDDDHLKLHAGEVTVLVQRSPCRIAFLSASGKQLAADEPRKGMASDGRAVWCWKRLDDDDHFFGLGERTGPLDKRGQSVVNWNHDAAEHDTWSDPLYQSHPFTLVLNGGEAYGLFFDNPHRSFFDLGKTSPDSYSFGAAGGEMNYYFIPGPAPKDVLRRYARLVGSAPLPPLWALGYQQCRYSYESARRVRQIAKRLRDRKIPCDTIYFDIDYMDGFKCFTWHPKHFANPKKLIGDLDKQGFKVVVIIDPGIKHEAGYSVYDQGLRGDHFCYDGNGEHYVGRVWPGDSVFPDFTRPATREWWGDLYRGLVETGVTGFWNDMNEPADFTFAHKTIPPTVRFDNEGEPTEHGDVHNIYGMQMARATFEGLERLRSDSRPFVLTRAGYAGVQRYAAVWTGDNLSSWEHLRMSIPMLLNMGMSGLIFSGADIGGFRDEPSAELYTRWLQLGIFYPLCRSHSVGEQEQDPTAFGARHERINRSAIELRYRLLPYIYTEFREASRDGLPLLRPLLLDFPDAPNVHLFQRQFMFGRQLLAAPVVEAGAKIRKVFLPPGRWRAFATGALFQGGREHEMPVDLDSIPLFARDGAVIPTRAVAQHTGAQNSEELTLIVFPGSGEGCYYNDDGESLAYKDGASVFERYEARQTRSQRQFTLSARSGDEAFAPVRYLIGFRGVLKAPKVVRVAGEAVARKKSLRAMNRKPGWFFDRAEHTLWVRAERLDAGAVVTVK